MSTILRQLVSLWRWSVDVRVNAPNYSHSPLERCEPGPLSAGQLQLLTQLATAVASRWSLGDVDLGRLEEFLRLKAEEPPSYLAVYRQTCELIGRWDGVAEKALDGLLKSDERSCQAAREYVLYEFIRFQLAAGASRFQSMKFVGFASGKHGYRQADLPRLQRMRKSGQ